MHWVSTKGWSLWWRRCPALRQRALFTLQCSTPPAAPQMSRIIPWPAKKVTLLPESTRAVPAKAHPGLCAWPALHTPFRRGIRHKGFMVRSRSVCLNAVTGTPLGLVAARPALREHGTVMAGGCGLLQLRSVLANWRPPQVTARNCNLRWRHAWPLICTHSKRQCSV